MWPTQPKEGKLLTTPARYRLLALHNPMQRRNVARNVPRTWMLRPISSQCRCLYGLLDIYCLSDMYCNCCQWFSCNVHHVFKAVQRISDSIFDMRQPREFQGETCVFSIENTLLWMIPTLLFWHSFWHTIWKYLWLLYSDTLPGILSDIYSDILSDMQLRSSSADWDLQLDCQGEGRKDGLTSDKI